ncbi:MAG: hypothetical protein K8T20_11830 [Planctomycetes bacterium]|nr:hypothetical protein [Planctomycetota bacterium]
MAAGTTPIFPASVAQGMVQISTANANRDGTGTIGTLVTGGANGTRIDRIVIKATVTTTAGMIRFFIYDGTNTRLIREILVTAITASATVAAFESDLLTPDLYLPTSSYQLKVSTEKAEAFNVHAFGGQY